MTQLVRVEAREACVCVCACWRRPQTVGVCTTQEAVEHGREKEPADAMCKVLGAVRGQRSAAVESCQVSSVEQAKPNCFASLLLCGLHCTLK